MKMNNGEDFDWFDELTEEQQHGVFTALEQLDRGEGIPHEEVDVKTWINNSTGF